MTDCFEQKCTVTENDTLGSVSYNIPCSKGIDQNIERFVTASKNIRAGEEILYEKPVLITPHWDSNLVCSKCYHPSLKICQKCNVFPLCNNCVQHGSFECNFFQEHTDISRNLLVENFKLFGPVRFLLFLENPLNDGYFNEILKMESHLNNRKNSDVWKLLEEGVVQPLKKSGMGKYLKKCNILESDFIQKICAIFDVNMFEVRGPREDSLRACFMKACLFAHSCIPNIAVAVDDEYEMKVYATTNIKEGDILYYNYTTPFLGSNERRKQLMLGKYFTCKCPRCEDPTELGSYISAIKCIKCIEDNCAEYGYVLNYGDNKWMCDQCSKITPYKEIEEYLVNIGKQVDDAQGDICKMEMLLLTLAEHLHDHHYFILDLKQNIAAILRSMCDDSKYTGCKGHMRRKLQLCEQILPILRIILPGISRIKGIALFEYYRPIIELARLEEDGGDHHHLNELLKAEKILREAYLMLKYEPEKSPEGLLAQQIFTEIETLKVDIKAAREKVSKNKV
ncbi:SET domain-containing protein SmydA-8-like isoform X2 [Condylostylus longicornis]|uniref:SET domain-containing protein SmydA-8-like isoform X2 n=1 Tax=Condylostylus longicornis TaxID=2530218 RepID=UPI00244E1F52|nr:SET domain-containing protein SmydA-8-like isoform X2 [Condylostylus longicornis]